MRVASSEATGPTGRLLSRWLYAAFAAIAIVWLSLLMMQRMIRAPAAAPAAHDVVDGVRMAKFDRKPESETPPPPALPPAAPPAAPPSLARADLPGMPVSTIAIAPATIDAAALGAPVAIGTGLGLGQSGVFGGFAGRGGSGRGDGSGSDYGTGEDFIGKDLLPISTARPQMPEWACKKKIKGWVEAIFIVMPNGHVTNVRIIDAQPRGVYEAAAIESISNWLYEGSSQTREVKQRVEMDPDDCKYNWHTQ